ncbi:hypothetical protein A4A58_01735 [Tardiphaga robiniae]|uniref:Uncharacterized protein n=2 Tax=Tardiphaga robiniae TaxID=943830 RepID=A0A164ARY2_9BRAD|nr:hypothetical protein A4A58_01735 [Tardiphaga robiniae]
MRAEALHMGLACLVEIDDIEDRAMTTRFSTMSSHNYQYADDRYKPHAHDEIDIMFVGRTTRAMKSTRIVMRSTCSWISRLASL